MDNQPKSKKWLWIVAGIIILLIIFVLFFKNIIPSINIANFKNCQSIDLTNTWREEIADFERFTILHDGIEREYYVHTPPSYDKTIPMPVVITFHGGGADWISAVAASGMDKKADKEGFIVVSPSGIDKQWNVGPRANPKYERDTDDVGFIREMISQLEASYNIDSKRIYATGLSNGGMISYELACLLSDKIAAVAPVETALMYHNCNPSRPISVIHFHSTSDKYVPYYGGQTTHDPSIPEILWRDDIVRSANGSISYWVNKNNCSKIPKITFENCSATCETYSPCDEGTEVTLCTINGTNGHTWPGGTQGYGPSVKTELGRQLVIKLLGNITGDISATDEMWKFFQKHPMP